MLQDKLLEEKESPLMAYLLSHLSLSDPSVRSVSLLTIVALLVHNDILDNERLLHHSLLLNFFLDSNFNLEALRVRLCPEELSIDKFHSFEASQVLKANS